MEEALGSRGLRRADGFHSRHFNLQCKKTTRKTASSSCDLFLYGTGAYFTKTSPLPESISKVSASSFEDDPFSFLTLSSRPFGSESSLSKSITHDAVSSSHLTTSLGAFERSAVTIRVTFESLSLSRVSPNRFTTSLEGTLATI